MISLDTSSQGALRFLSHVSESLNGPNTDPRNFLWLVVLGGIVCFMTAFAIGANDVANTFSPAVGSKALPMWVAILLAGILETAGATLLGGAVTDSIRTKIIDFSYFADSPSILMLGMFCGLLGAGIWLIIATHLGLPVSSTHSIIGALLGVGLATGRVKCIFWMRVSFIVLSWLAAPLLAASSGMIVFGIIRMAILRQRNSLKKGIRILWIFIWLIVLSFSFFLVFKNPFVFHIECNMATANGSAVGFPCIVSKWASANGGIASGVAILFSLAVSPLLCLCVYKFAFYRLKLYRLGLEKSRRKLEFLDTQCTTPYTQTTNPTTVQDPSHKCKKTSTEMNTNAGESKKEKGNARVSHLGTSTGELFPNDGSEILSPSFHGEDFNASRLDNSISMPVSLSSTSTSSPQVHFRLVPSGAGKENGDGSSEDHLGQTHPPARYQQTPYHCRTVTINISEPQPQPLSPAECAIVEEYSLDRGSGRWSSDHHGTVDEQNPSLGCGDVEPIRDSCVGRRVKNVYPTVPASSSNRRPSLLNLRHDVQHFALLNEECVKYGHGEGECAHMVDVHENSRGSPDSGDVEFSSQNITDTSLSYNQHPTSLCSKDDGEAESDVADEEDTPHTFWQKMRKAWLSLPWFKDIHGESEDEDHYVTTLRQSAEVFDIETEIFFSACQVVSACLGCLAHSANDTANAIGPFAAILTIYNAGIETEVQVPWYVLTFGGLSMAIGLAVWGYRVIKTVGVKLIFLTPCRGFSVELASAWVVLVFSNFGIPLSTTHCAVGSTLGVGLMEPKSHAFPVSDGSKRCPITHCFNTESVHWKLFGKVFVSWIFTIFFSALVSAVVFSFPAYSPTFLL